MPDAEFKQYVFDWLSEKHCQMLSVPSFIGDDESKTQFVEWFCASTDSILKYIEERSAQ
jgi:hypothetical protein